MKKEKHLKKDRDGKSGRNWFDRVLFLLLAGGIILAFFAVRYLRTHDRSEWGTLTYTVQLSNVDVRAYGEDSTILREGDRVRSQNGTVVLGTVTSLERRPHRETVVENGTLSTVELPTRADFLITVTASASRRSGDGIRVGDIRIAAGSEMTIRVGDFLASSVVVTRVDWEAEEHAE